MPHIIIDGQRIETSDGKTVIEAAYDAGLQIPHFCWHPELSISGNCRMCLIELGMPRRNPDGSFAKDDDGNDIINYFPKLQIACATYVSEGMRVNTQTEKVVKAREAVMEFQLINHPLDCPICDEAGQCKLQEYAYKHSKGHSRFIEEKNHAKKRQKWGPNVLFDAERCITCSRCIRYAREIAGQDVLTFVNRGDHVTIKLFEDTVFDNPYSMNVIELCPVGALTSPDFRFKTRVWEMTFNDSVCVGCSRGCNMRIGVRNNEVLRLEPRTNMSVNKYWMCDYGRLSYKSLNEKRITTPRAKIGGESKETSWEEALDFAAKELKKFNSADLTIIGSDKSSCETLYLLQKFAKKVIKTPNLDFVKHVEPDFADDFLKTANKAPNAAGALEMGVKPDKNGASADELEDRLKKDFVSALVVVEEDFADRASVIPHMKDLDLLIVFAHSESKLTEIADVVLPASTFAEIEGTFVNENKRVQRFSPALVTNENRAKMGAKMSRLDKFGSHNDRWTQHENRDCRPSWRILNELAKKLGANWNYRKASEVFAEIESNISSFKGMTYDLLDEYKGLTLNKAKNPEPKKCEYISYVMKPQ